MPNLWDRVSEFHPDMPLVLTKQQVIDIAFSLRTQATNNRCEPATDCQQHSWHAFRASAYYEAEPQFYFEG